MNQKNSPPQRQFFGAIVNGERDEVRALVAAEVSLLDAYDDATPLHLAAWNDCASAAEALLENGADINMRSGTIHNNSPAGWAIVAGSADVFELLIDNGAAKFDFFIADAEAAVAGEFLKYKNVPQENYDRILARLRNA